MLTTMLRIQYSTVTEQSQRFVEKEYGMKTITIGKAISKAIALFNCAGLGDIRTIELYEGSGSGNKWTSLLIHIGYAKDGDYTESDKNPFLASIRVQSDGTVTVDRA